MQTFDAWCHGAQSASEQSQLCELSGPTFGFTTREFSMVGGYTENPEKPQNRQNWGWAFALIWVLARNNTVPQLDEFILWLQKQLLFVKLHLQVGHACRNLQLENFCIHSHNCGSLSSMILLSTNREMVRL